MKSRSGNGVIGLDQNIDILHTWLMLYMMMDILHNTMADRAGIPLAMI